MFWNSSQYHNLETLGARQLSFFNQARRNCPDFQDKLTCRAQSPGQVSLRIGRLEFWMSREQFGYWSHTHLTVDVVQGRGSGFSVEAPEGKRFLIRSTLMDWPV